MTLPTIAFIGAGNMGESLLSGLIANDHPRDQIYVSDPNGARLTALQEKWGIQVTTDNHEAIKHASIVVFAVKPQQLQEAALHAKDAISAKQPLVISIAAGIRQVALSRWLGTQTAIVRAMPNMPALIGAGMTALHANAHVTQEGRNLAESVLRAVGMTIWVKDESHLDIVTALSGSGPAYFFYVMEALQNAGETLGLSAETARLLILQTALGAARMALESEESLQQLREYVTSKGGTTEQAIQVLEAANIKDTFKQAVTVSKIRAEELAELLGGD